MNITETDLLWSLDWLETAQKSHTLGRSQQALDRVAITYPERRAHELSPEVLELCEDAIVEACDYPRTGKPAECLSRACQFVIKMASEETWEKLIADGFAYKAQSWKPIWLSIRAEGK